MKGTGKTTNTMDKDSTWIQKVITSVDNSKTTNQKGSACSKKETEVFIKEKCKKHT